MLPLVRRGPHLAAALCLAPLLLGTALGQGARDKKKKAKDGTYIAPAAKGERIKDTLKAGDKAPPFTLPRAVGEEEVTLAAVSAKKPVVLIFASCT